ncbi:CYTH and CHAD domain-containing protein [Bosea sp. 117]|uniref:CYTH and CHAD domain-containing protein n=1 Tax=Bosea sp. 117 TaxID=1125973 RepID=UPI00068FBCB5|nr:CYTH and CHAD domain-containing protein [Bosea sp. 117]
MDGETHGDRPLDVASHREVELKLLAPPGTLEQIRMAPAVARDARSQGVVRRLETVYYDTPDHLLFRHQASLRVRRIGTRFVETLKLPADDDPLSRPEFEAPLASAAPDLTVLPLAGAALPFELPDSGALVPVFAARIRRRLVVMERPDARIELALDEGEIAAGAERTPVCEIELELKSGEAATLYELGLALLDVAPLRFGTLSKAERGYRLAFAEPPVAEKAGPLALGEDAAVDDALAAMLASCHRQLLGNLAAAEAGRAEGVHQLRVALRRLRSALALFAHLLPSAAFRALNAEARLMGRALGPARGWDVFVGETLAGIARTGLEPEGFARLREAAEPLRRAAHSGVRDQLADPRTTRFLLGLGHLIERRGWRNDVSSEALGFLAEPAVALAQRMLDRARRGVLKRGRHFRGLAPEERHELRLKLKRLRYTVDFVLPLYPGDARAQTYLRRLSKLQDVLGADNDAATTGPLLRELQAAGTAPALHRAIGIIAGWQESERQHTAPAIHDKWRRFRDTEPFWER